MIARCTNEDVILSRADGEGFQHLSKVFNFEVVREIPRLRFAPVGMTK